MEVFLKSNKVKIINKPLYYYRLGGNTSKFMPYLFQDIVNGYKIQKDIIQVFYQHTLEKHYDGISIMLLNTFKTCLYNLINGKLNVDKAKEMIKTYTNNEILLEALSNKKALGYFPPEFIMAIKNRDVDYLYNIGLEMHNKSKYKRFALKMLSIL
jgi:hypothetical protein